MVKDAPKHILMNTIGLAQTSRELLEDDDILISPVVLITQKALRYNRSRPGSHYPPSARRLIQLVYDRTFSANMQYWNSYYFQLWMRNHKWWWVFLIWGFSVMFVNAYILYKTAHLIIWCKKRMNYYHSMNLENK